MPLQHDKFSLNRRDFLTATAAAGVRLIIPDDAARTADPAPAVISNISWATGVRSRSLKTRA